jgi:hypothetical protein
MVVHKIKYLTGEVLLITRVNIAVVTILIEFTAIFYSHKGPNVF